MANEMYVYLERGESAALFEKIAALFASNLSVREVCIIKQYWDERTIFGAAENALQRME